MEEFLQYKDKWEEFTLTDYEWRLEGRVSFVIGTSMTLTNCPMSFVLTEEMVRSRGNTGVVEVTGRITKGDGKLVFRATSLASRPKDRDRLRQMRFGIDSEKPADWFKVADWGHQRAKFYDDPSLETDAVELDRFGVRTALRQLNLGDESGLAAVLETARQKKVGTELEEIILHQTLQARRSALGKQKWDAASYAQLEADILRQLPGSQQQLKVWPEELERRYMADPVRVYTELPVEQRVTLNRLFAVSVISERILHDAAADGSNGLELADQFRDRIPERPNLAIQALKEGIRFHEKRVPMMTRSQLEEFCRRLERENESLLATEVKKTWLKGRETQHREDGARGLADLADQWMSLLQDQATATQFYIEAWETNKEYAPARDWLSTHGMKLIDGRWLPEAVAAAMPVPPIEKAIRDGRVEIGMTRRQVLSALGGPPTRMTRIATSQGMGEWWEYDTSGVVIRFVRSRRSSETVVEKIESSTREQVIAPQ